MTGFSPPSRAASAACLEACVCRLSIEKVCARPIQPRGSSGSFSTARSRYSWAVGRSRVCSAIRPRRTSASAGGPSSCALAPKTHSVSAAAARPIRIATTEFHYRVSWDHLAVILEVQAFATLLSMTRRALVPLVACLAVVSCSTESPARRPNILFAIWDDVSYPHVSAAGSKMVTTPAFDRVAAEGALFRNAYAPAPGCSPTRAAFLTGRHIWMIEQAGTHASSFPTTYISYQDLLEEAGYAIGYTGKPWGPGRWEKSGRTRNPAGPPFMEHTLEPPYSGIRDWDYAGNFEAFFEAKEPGQPFSFWVGGSEAHRRFEQGSWKAAGKRLEDAEVPPFLPDTPEIREDLLDYAVEIEWFDSHIGRILDFLGEQGELDNTLVIFTADNGMAFPRAKANLYDYGIHMPLAVRWAGPGQSGRTIDDLVQFVDLTATILDRCRREPSGRSQCIGRAEHSRDLGISG